MADTQLGKGRSGTFGRSLMQLIADKLPYNSSPTIIDEIDDANPKFKHFYKTGSSYDNLLAKHSISKSVGNELDPAGSVAIDKNYHQLCTLI